MTSQGSTDAKLEAFESRVEDRLRALFAEFGLGRTPSPTKFQQSASLERPLKKKERATDMRQPRMREDFPRWEGDLTRWISRAERVKHSQISSYLHDFSKEWTIMLKVLPDDDHRSKAHDPKKIESLQKDDSTQIHPLDIPIDEEVEVQLMITWDRRIVMHHRLNTTTPDGEIQDNTGPSDHIAPTVDTIRKLQGELQIETQSSSLSLEDKADLKRVGLLGL
ncbi:hypothetical protein BHM03_00040047 [Ensete ventricosum]|nr:hypothetical protein BHM03_00040047 [Ensete ventricosum]